MAWTKDFDYSYSANPTVAAGGTIGDGLTSADTTTWYVQAGVLRRNLAIPTNDAGARVFGNQTDARVQRRIVFTTDVIGTITNAGPESQGFYIAAGVKFSNNLYGSALAKTGIHALADGGSASGGQGGSIASGISYIYDYQEAPLPSNGGFQWTVYVYDVTAPSTLLHTYVSQLIGSGVAPGTPGIDIIVDPSDQASVGIKSIQIYHYVAGPVVASVTVSPKTATGSGVFTATVSQTGGTGGIAWTASPNVGSFSSTSSLTPNYTAPAATASQQVITLTATSTDDGTKFDTAVVTIAATSTVLTLATVTGLPVVTGTNIAITAPTFTGGVGAITWQWKYYSVVDSTTSIVIQSGTGTPQNLSWNVPAQYQGVVGWVAMTVTDGTTTIAGIGYAQTPYGGAAPAPATTYYPTEGTGGFYIPVFAPSPPLPTNADIVAAFNPANIPAGQKIVLVEVGDSITYYRAASFPGGIDYLQTYLDSIWPNKFVVVNGGHSGANVSDWLPSATWVSGGSTASVIAGQTALNNFNGMVAAAKAANTGGWKYVVTSFLGTNPDAANNPTTYNTVLSGFQDPTIGFGASTPIVVHELLYWPWNQYNSNVKAVQALDVTMVEAVVNTGLKRYQGAKPIGYWLGHLARVFLPLDGHPTYPLGVQDLAIIHLQSIFQAVTATNVFPAPTSLTLTPATTTGLAIGATVQLTAVVRDLNSATMTGQTVTFSSSNSNAIVTNSGLVTGYLVGDAIITATSGLLSATATVTILPVNIINNNNNLIIKVNYGTNIVVTVSVDNINSDNVVENVQMLNKTITPIY